MMCPSTWQIQPAVNNHKGIFQNPRTSGAIRKSEIETPIMGNAKRVKDAVDRILMTLFIAIDPGPEATAGFCRHRES